MGKPLAILALLAGIVALVAVPRFQTAMNHSKQKRTTADIRAVATAWEARAEITRRYTLGPRQGNLAAVDDEHLPWSAMPEVSAADLKRALVPTYIRQLPEVDGWGHPLQFRATDDSYAIRSLGRDGRPEAVTTYQAGVATTFDEDLVYANGVFVRRPEGM